MNEELNEPNPGQYELVGWLSITSAILVLPSMVLGIFLEVGRKPAMLFLLVPYVLLFGLSIAFSLYALYRFKALLNDRYQFHDVDNIITAIVILTCILGSIGICAKIGGAFLKISFKDPSVLLPVAIGGVTLFAVVGLPLCVLSIVFAVRLLRLQDSLYGLLKPYAYTTIVASAFFATFLFAFLGFVLDAACSIMLGLIFLRAARGLPTPEFV